LGGEFIFVMLSLGALTHKWCGGERRGVALIQIGEPSDRPPEHSRDAESVEESSLVGTQPNDHFLGDISLLIRCRNLTTISLPLIAIDLWVGFV
jgi:hypothetical protein